MAGHLITNKPRRRRRRRITESFLRRDRHGANVYQNRGGNRTFTQDNPNLLGFGDTLTVDPKNDVGFLAALNSVTFSARV